MHTVLINMHAKILKELKYPGGRGNIDTVQSLFYNGVIYDRR
jgi:hypothetical protein